MDDNQPADEIIENGLGEIARGIYRMAHTEQDTQRAYELAMAVVSVVRGMAFDMLKSGKAKP